MDFHSVGIVTLDSYMSPPIQGLDVMYSEFRGSSISQVPVLTVFGSVPSGEKICIHVHGVFPYLYIPYDGAQDANSLMYKIAGNLDKAINISLNQAMSNMQHVFKIELVSGIPMYGYHHKEHQFFKIYLYNPLLLRKVTALLMNETTLGNQYQPHEAHLNFTLQFMIDYNLHGMSNMILSKLKYRRDLQHNDSDTCRPSSISKMTVCDLEGDCLVEDIVNREEVASGNIGANPGIAALWADEEQRRRNRGLNSQLEHLLELKRTVISPTNSHLLYKQALRERLTILSNEKNTLDKFNSSVYPAETPNNMQLKNAYNTDSQTPTFYESSFTSSGLDETLGQAEVSISLDEDAKQLLGILNELERNANESLEEDSILTQVTKEDADEKEMDDNDLDFSIFLEDVTTPTKVIPEETNEEESDNDLWDTTLIPQLDGGYDESIEDLETESIQNINSPALQIHPKHSLRTALYVKIIKGKDMPLLNEDTCHPVTYQSIIDPSILSTLCYTPIRKHKKRLRKTLPHKNKKTVKQQKLIRIKKENVKKTELEVKRLQNRINKIRREDQLAAIIMKLHKKENELIVFLEKNNQPKFRVIPRDQVKALISNKSVNRNEGCIVNVLSDIMIQMPNYVDPTLHFTIKYPNHCCYLYMYASNFLPKIIEIPATVCQSNNERDLDDFIKQHVTNQSWFVDKKCEKFKNLFPSNALGHNNIQQNKENIYYEKEDTYSDIFLDTNLSHAKYVGVAMDMRWKTDEEIRQLAQDLTKELNKHIQSLSLTQQIENAISFSSKEERFKVLNSIECLKTDEDFSKSFKFNKEYDANKKLHVSVNNIHVCPYNTRSKTSKLKENASKTENIGEDESKVTNSALNNNNGNDINRRRKRVYTGEIRRSRRLNFLDGTFDSDTSSEDEKKGNRRSSRTPKRISRYKSLPITVDKSPKPSISVNKTGGAISDLMSLTQTHKIEAPPIIRISQNPVCDENVKRQLFGKEESFLDRTIIEEKLVCSYSSKLKNILPVTGFSNDKSFSDKNSHDKSDVDDSSHSSIIFSSDNEIVEKSSSKCQNLNIFDNRTTAEKYDEKAKYQAREGCSKFITPESSQNALQDKVLSSENSSTDLLTPYQRPVHKNIQKLIIIEEEYVTEEVMREVCSPGSYKSRFDSFLQNSEIVTIVPKFSAPTKEEVFKSLDNLKIFHVNHEYPYYSNLDDVTGSVEVGFNVLKINSKTTAHLPDFESQTDILNNFRKASLEQLPSNVKLTKYNINNTLLSHCLSRECIITPVKQSPNGKTVRDWLEQKSKRVPSPENRTEKVKIYVPLSPGAKSDDENMDTTLTLSPLSPKSSQNSCNRTVVENTPRSSKASGSASSAVFESECKKRKREIYNTVRSKALKNSLTLSQENSINNSGQITGISVSNTYLNKSVQNLQKARAIIEHQNLTVLVLELHIRTRGDFKPDPTYDSIRAIFYSILHDVPEPNPKGRRKKGVIAINSVPLSPGTNKIPILDGIGCDYDITYVDSEDTLIDGFLKFIDYWDPDIFAGYEIELLSWGYLIERSNVLGKNLKPMLGRIRQNNTRIREDDVNELRLSGRIVLDVWRVMRHEIALQSYTIESMAYHILHKRLPLYSFKDLSFWWDHKTQLYRHKTVKHYITRVVTILELFDKLDFLGRTSELARLFGIQFFEVLSRGSQFRVESMMLRLAKPLNFIAVSPNVQQRAHMKAPEYIALVMEPESKLYNDPVIVLDFQSLYPSIIIAYNYCFTTCIGRVQSLGKSGPFEFGATQLKVSRTRLKKLLERDLLNFSPCGVGFVKKGVRDGIMPRMLREILDTRLMVKNSMKENKNDIVLQKVLHNRQLGLKLIANVTYGYTAANFSGRMPAVELGDSVVSKGRETLQRAIALVDNTPEWGVRVVYGDTDSLFVLVPGRTKEHAFEIGKLIADAVTNDNPDPIKLKLEKVYQPCILQTKKRYVGYMYETPDQIKPIYEAKGIETVRRDGCPAVSKMLEKCLRILFETKDVSLIKKYVINQFNKIIAGRVSIQDLTFAKEYRGAAGYRPGACVPALELAKRWTAVDRKNEPRSGERVPYVIIHGPPGLPLIRMVRSPRDLLLDASLKPNAVYYITRVIIPPLNRCLNLIGADVNNWFNQMPRKKIQYFSGSVSPKKKTTISHYFSTSSCVSCDEQTQTGLCEICLNSPQTTMFTLMEKMRVWESNYNNTIMICQTCTSSMYEVKCISLDCPLYYRRVQTNRDEQQTAFIRQLLSASEF